MFVRTAAMEQIEKPHWQTKALLSSAYMLVFLFVELSSHSLRFLGSFDGIRPFKVNISKKQVNLEGLFSTCLTVPKGFSTPIGI